MSSPEFSVQIVETDAPWGWTRHMKVQRRDGKDGITWDELQVLKDEHLGPEVLAVEIFPPADAVVNEVNMRHLWECPAVWLGIGLGMLNRDNSTCISQ